MIASILTFYADNSVFRGAVHLCLIAGILAAISVIIIGHERKHARDRIHPWFGRYTINIPNLMSYIRFPLGLWVFVAYYFPVFHSPAGFFSVHLSFALVCLFDFLDGKFARKWNAITEGGKSLDPAADKWVTSWLAITAYLYGGLRWWALAIVIVRELVSMFQRHRLKKRGVDVSARWLGKIKTGVQFTVLYIILLRSDRLPGTVLLESPVRLFPPELILWGTILMCFCTVISIFPFFKSFSYVNDYTLSQREESDSPWYIVIWPNLLTVGNYLCGVTAVFFAMPEIEVQYRSFVILFWGFAAGVCDAFDGPLSRKLKTYSEFGACLDSSTDLSTFGLAVAVVIFLRFSAIKGGSSFLGILMAIIYFMFVHLRLARFTKLSHRETDRGKKKDFVGLPSPSGAAGVLIFFTFFNDIQILSLGVLILSLLMYSRFDLISHSNSIQHPLYKYFLIPTLFAGFGMLSVLVFQQPFVSRHFSRELIDYFNVCSWILFVPLIIYILDGIRRTYFKVRWEIPK